MLRSALLALLVALPGAAAAEEWTSFYLKAYGGTTAEDALGVDAYVYDLQRGNFLGGAIGFATPVPGLSVELDLSHSRANYAGDTNALEATLAMANVVYSLPVNDNFGLYGGLGLGYAHVIDDCLSYDQYDASGSAAAAQIFAGAEVTLIEAVSFFGELRYQSALETVSATSEGEGTFGVDYARAALLVGIKVEL
jgi:opacity protein-like surface antigen